MQQRSALQDIDIRAAVPDDVAGISRLLRSSSHAYIVAPQDPGVAEFLSTLDEVPLSNFIARADVVYLVAINSGKGLGRRLWLRLRDHALRAGNPGVFEVNASLNAVPIYARFGFAIAAPKIEKHGGAYVPMLLKLKSSN